MSVGFRVQRGAVSVGFGVQCSSAGLGHIWRCQGDYLTGPQPVAASPTSPTSPDHSLPASPANALSWLLFWL